jgi:hypothetical protein
VTARRKGTHGLRVIIYDNRDVGPTTKFEAAGVPDLAAIIKASTTPATAG